jgi:putative ABC transport system substrate-binding protein
MQFDWLRRREFIALFGGAATWPLAAPAQQVQRMWRIGVLMNTAAANAEGRAGISAFQQVLQDLGWAEDHNLRIEIRWGENDIDRTRQYAVELIAFSPDIFLASGTVSTRR